MSHVRHRLLSHTFPGRDTIVERTTSVTPCYTWAASYFFHITVLLPNGIGIMQFQLTENQRDT